MPVDLPFVEKGMDFWKIEHPTERLALMEPAAGTQKTYGERRRGVSQPACGPLANDGGLTLCAKSNALLEDRAPDGEFGTDGASHRNTEDLWRTPPRR